MKKNDEDDFEEVEMKNSWYSMIRKMKHLCKFKSSFLSKVLCLNLYNIVYWIQNNYFFICLGINSSPNKYTPITYDDLSQCHRKHFCFREGG